MCATALRPKPTACQTSGASQMMPIATAIVEPTSAQNHSLDHSSKSARIILLRARARSGSSGNIGLSEKEIDRNEFFLTFLELAGLAYVIALLLCIWEFTIGIKESIKNLFNR